MLLPPDTIDGKHEYYPDQRCIDYNTDLTIKKYTVFNKKIWTVYAPYFMRVSFGPFLLSPAKSVENCRFLTDYAVRNLSSEFCGNCVAFVVA